MLSKHKVQLILSPVWRLSCWLVHIMLSWGTTDSADNGTKLQLKNTITSQQSEMIDAVLAASMINFSACGCCPKHLAAIYFHDLEEPSLNVVYPKKCGWHFCCFMALTDTSSKYCQVVRSHGGVVIQQACIGGRHLLLLPDYAHNSQLRLFNIRTWIWMKQAWNSLKLSIKLKLWCN